MTRSPDVSVVIPCFNTASFLPAAVRSVRSQGGVVTEVVVVDDASTDGSAAVAERLAADDPGVRVVRRAVNGGPATARNAGLRLASGRYVAFLDADDEYAPGFLAAAAQILDADPSVAGLVTGVELVDCHRPVDPVQLEAVIHSLPANLLLRRNVVERVGGFPEDPAFRGQYAGEDIAFRQAIARHFRLVRAAAPALRYRVRAGGHFDRFLDRSVVVNGRLVFTRTDEPESPDRVADASVRYLASVRERVGTPIAPNGLSEFLTHVSSVPHGHPPMNPTPVAERPADDPLAVMHAGVDHARQGRLADALPLLERAVALAPTLAQARLNRGVALLESGQPADAEAELREAVRLDPNYAEAHFNLGNVLRDQGRSAEAVEHYRTAVRLRPDHAGAVTNLGLAVLDTGRTGEAVTLLSHAVRLDTGSKEAHNNLGLALADAGRFVAAEEAYGRALAVDPRFADALSNLAGCLRDQGRLEESVACYDLAVSLAPAAPGPRYNRSLALLQADDPRGWTEYEWRWRRGVEQERVAAHPAPRWDGSSPAGRTVLVWAEQGLGDAIQFIRYARRLAAHGARVVVECPVRLKPLLATCPGVAEVVGEGEPIPPHDWQIPLLSLPAVLGSPPAVDPWEGPYLSADPERSRAWERRLASRSGFKVGLMWQGNPHYRRDRWRSAPLTAFEPLSTVPGVALFGLQVGAGVGQVAGVASRFRVEDLAPDPDPAGGAFLDTAAILPHLDLAIAVDSAVAHLAGAMGVPVWVVLSTTSDWRWGMGRGDTPWYPSLRLYRQRVLGEWDELFGRVARDLAGAVGYRAGGRAVPVDVAPGELLDKITILELKLARLTDPSRLAHVRVELAALTSARDACLPADPEVDTLVRELAAENAAIWEVEEVVRACERAGEFGPRFVVAARGVYRHNDRRAAVKRRINDRLGAKFVEVKSYPVEPAGVDDDPPLLGIPVG